MDAGKHPALLQPHDLALTRTQSLKLYGEGDSRMVDLASGPLHASCAIPLFFGDDHAPAAILECVRPARHLRARCRPASGRWGLSMRL